MAEITDFGPKKTIFILAIVAGCFAVLWPKIFYPMLTASVTPQHSSDNSACCDVIFESDVTAADIMQEICQNIVKHHQVDPRVRGALRNNKLTTQTASLCREEVLARCGIDLSTFLAQRGRIGKSYKQVLEEIRTFNSSLCLKIHFGIPLSQLGKPHLIRYHILMPHSTIRQERRTPPHAGGLHPALKERGRAIPSSHIVPKVVDRPDQVIPKMRPPLGGAGHVVAAPKGNGTMGIIMPLYTFGIVLFFLYTIVKVLKKNSDSDIITEYTGSDAEREFRKMVFNPETLTTAMTAGAMSYKKEKSPSPHLPPPTLEELKDQAAGDIEIDQLRRRLVETEAAMERIVVQMGNISRSVMHSPSSQHEPKEDTAAQDKDSKAEDELENLESPTVKVMGMEMTASCEGGQKGSRPTTPIIPTPPSHVDREKTPPKPIYLEGALPSQCELLVTDSETQAQKAEEDAEAPVVLSGKMTLSLISLDQIAAESEDENLKIGDTGEDENLEVEAAEEEEVKEILTHETGVQRTPNQKLFEEVKTAEREDEEQNEFEVEDEEEEEIEFEVEDEEEEEIEFEDEEEEVEVEEMEEDIKERDPEQHRATGNNVEFSDDAEEDEEEEEEIEVEVEEEDEDELEVEEIEVDDEDVEEEKVEIEAEEEADEEAEYEAEEDDEEDEVEDEEVDEAYHDKAVKNRLTISAEEESEDEENGDGRTGLPYSKRVNPNKRD